MLHSKEVRTFSFSGSVDINVKIQDIENGTEIAGQKNGLTSVSSYRSYSIGRPTPIELNNKTLKVIRLGWVGWLSRQLCGGCHTAF